MNPMATNISNIQASCIGLFRVTSNCSLCKRPYESPANM